MGNKIFFDTYALIEIDKSNPEYKSYTKGISMILSELNLLEYSYYLLRTGREREINNIFAKLSGYCVEYDEDVLIEAAKMKFKMKKDKLSFIDCIGYLLAKKNKAKFLTGDNKFKSKDNVLFVK